MPIRYRDLLAVIARASDVGMARPEYSAELTALAAHRIAVLAGHSQPIHTRVGARTVF